MGDTGNVLVGVAEIVVDDGTNPAVTIGYTTDGVTMTIRSSFSDTKVEENIGTIIRKLTDQEVQVTLNMAEGDLGSMCVAIPGSSLDNYATPATLTIGGADLREFELVLTGEAPDGGSREIKLNAVNAIGEVGIPYKKGEISVVPVTFACLVADPVPPAISGVFGTIIDTPGP